MVKINLVKRILASLIVAMCAMMSTAFAAKPVPAPPNGMINLVQGKRYTVTPLVSTKYSFALAERKYYLKGALTDGRSGSATSFDDGQWQGYDYGGTRSVVIDIRYVSTVRQMQEKFIQDPESAVYFPREVVFALSLDGKDWGNVGTVKSSIPLTAKDVATQTYAVSGLNYRARFVRMTFTVDIWVFADEFQVFGTRGISKGAVIPKVNPPSKYPDAYCAPGSRGVAGVKDMVLIYNGYFGANSDTGKNTVDELTPYVGYQTTSGEIKDFMFDGVLFLPFVAAGAPSSGKYYCSSKHPTVKSDWMYYLDNTFSSSYNLGALNIATGNIKKTLDNPSYKEKVEIAIPYPTPTAADFGDVDGDGKPEDLSRLSDREKVVRWYIDEVMKRWSAANYTNLNLIGFYWYEEAADFDVDENEAAMLTYTGKYIRSLGKVFDWIPYYQAPGFAGWSSLGFSAAVMQPNFVFHNFPEEELGEAANACKKLGMGVELEVHWNALTDAAYRTKYYDYLNYGITKDYMKDAVHMYYQNGGPGTFYESCISKNPAVRAIYDQTYKFIKRTYRLYKYR